MRCWANTRKVGNINDKEGRSSWSQEVNSIIGPSWGSGFGEERRGRHGGMMVVLLQDSYDLLNRGDEMCEMKKQCDCQYSDSRARGVGVEIQGKTKQREGE